MHRLTGRHDREAEHERGGFDSHFHMGRRTGCRTRLEPDLGPAPEIISPLACSRSPLRSNRKNGPALQRQRRCTLEAVIAQRLLIWPRLVIHPPIQPTPEPASCPIALVPVGVYVPTSGGRVVDGTASAVGTILNWRRRKPGSPPNDDLSASAGDPGNRIPPSDADHTSGSRSHNAADGYAEDCAEAEVIRPTVATAHPPSL